MKISIRTKLLFSYVLLIFVTLLIVSLAFDYYTAQHFEKFLGTMGVGGGPAGGPGAGNLLAEGDKFLRNAQPFLRSVRQSLFIAAGGSGAFGLLLAVLFSKYLLSPIEKIIKVTKHIASGRYDQRVDVETGDELGDLAKALNQMAEKLQEIEVLRKDLVANVSHELSTPLTNIRGYLEALHEGVITDQDKKKKTFKILRDETERLTKLVKEVKALAEIDRVAMSRDFKKVDFANAVREVCESMEREFSAKKLMFEVEIEKKKIFVLGDEEKLKQMLVNLLANALRYTQKGSVKVKVYAEEGEVILEVSDTGVGIGTQDLPYIFERFYRAEKSRTTEGTGIGLSIVREIVEMHEADISVHSESGEGTTFICRFSVIR